MPSRSFTPWSSAGAAASGHRKVLERPAGHGPKALVVSLQNRLLDELSLAPLAVRADDQGASQPVGDLGAVMPTRP